MCSVAQSCPTLCGPMNGSPPGSSVHGIFQAKILEWVAISFQRNDKIMPPLLFSQTPLGYLFKPPGKPIARLDLYILNKFSISLLISAKKKKPIGILVVIALTLYINFGGSVQSLIRV